MTSICAWSDLLFLSSLLGLHLEELNSPDKFQRPMRLRLNTQTPRLTHFTSTALYNMVPSCPPLLQPALATFGAAPFLPSLNACLVQTPRGDSLIQWSRELDAKRLPSWHIRILTYLHWGYLGFTIRVFLNNVEA